MTLIAHINYKNVPILIGDAIVTSPRSSLTDIVLPLQQSPFFPASRWSDHIVDLQQKIHLIGDSVAIAWSGTRVTATTYIKDLEVLLDASIDIMSTLEEFFHKLKCDPHARDVVFIPVYVAHGKWHRFQHKAEFFDSPIYGEICGGGTGFWPLLQEFNERHNERRSFANDVPDDFNAKLFANSIVHGFMDEEYQAKLHLDYGFGGAYEIAVYYGERDQLFGKTIRLKKLLIEATTLAIWFLVKRSPVTKRCSIPDSITVVICLELEQTTGVVENVRVGFI